MVKVSVHPKKKRKDPEWLYTLLQNKFFDSCLDHRDLRKNEKNAFCIDCKLCFCQHCLSSSDHFDHKVLQIRRYVYHDVIRLQDMQKHLDCSKVQPYKINGASVVFLNPRPQSRPSKSNSGASCEVCDRSLTEPNRRCSIACKVSVVSQKASRDQNPPSLSLTALVISDFSVAENQNPEENLKGEESANSVVESREENLPHLNSALKLRKQLHRRKGIPCRAPFF